MTTVRTTGSAFKRPRPRSIIFEPSSLAPDSLPQHGLEPDTRAQERRPPSIPLRRCLLSNRVLPTEQLVRFELVRPPSSATASSSSSSRLLLTPSGVLHPRFDANNRARGKGMWVKCWREAVESLAKRGSYKRVHQSAYLEPTSAVHRVHSHLARRVVQETEMLSERAKSWPVSTEPSLSRCPVRRVSIDELDSWSQDFDGSDVVAVLDFSTLPAGTTVPFSSAFSSPSERSIPRYHLPIFFSDVILPPSDPSHASSSEAVLSTGDLLLSFIRTHLDNTISLYSRRAERALSSSSSSPASESSSPPSPPPPPTGDIYLLLVPSPPSSTSPYSPHSSASVEALRQRQRDDVEPLLRALKRCGLWLGEGWEGLDAAEGGGAKGKRSARGGGNVGKGGRRS